MSAAATASPSPAPSGGGGATVLSDKVSRALRVRTDTPAMRAALAALAGLPTAAGDDRPRLRSSTAAGGAPPSAAATAGGNGGGVIDARSVRAAIEEDALRRALEFQSELRRLADDAAELRERVGKVAGAAGLVRKRVEGRIWEAGEGEEEEVTGGGEEEENNLYNSAGDAWEAERSLASRLALAQKSCAEALRRRRAVDAFLDKFDLDDDEARLLDHYDFEGFSMGDAAQREGEGGTPWGRPAAAAWNVTSHPGEAAVEEAMAFMDALERLAVIRRELARAFGSGGTGGSNDGDDDGNVSFESEGGGADAASGGRLGTHSALRMMEHLSSRQERAHERLYLFVQFFLGIGAAAAPAPSRAPTSSSDAGRPSPSPSPPNALGRFRDGDEADEAYAHPIIRRAIHTLRHSPSRRVHLLELAASGRRTEVTRRFLLALSSGYGGAAPLEMGAHDPVGYVGDMLAFAFRAFRVEGELVRMLFEWREPEGGEGEGEDGDGGEGGAEAGGANPHEEAEGNDDEDDNDDEEGDNGRPMDVAEMLAQSMGGLARPLKTRISQVVLSLATQGGDGSGGRDRHGDAAARAHDDEPTSSSSLDQLVALFAVCGLLRFYGAAVAKALAKPGGGGGGGGGGGSTTDRRRRQGGATAAANPLWATCREGLAEAADAYVASLRAYGAMLATHALSSGESEARLARRAIVRVAEERTASPGFAEDLLAPSSSGGGGEEEDAVSKQLSLPFLVATMVDAALPHAKTLDDCAALKSALGASIKCGLDAADASKWTALVQERETALVEAFVDAEADEVLRVCGLEGLRSALRRMDAASVAGATMASHPGLSQATVEAAMKKFYASLYSPPIPTFEESIRDADVRKMARSKTAERVADAYGELYEAMTGERGGYDDVAFLGHTPTQVRTLLSM